MRNLLLVTSSLFGENSKSRAVALGLVEGLKRASPGAVLVARDAAMIPHLDGETLAALATAPESRSTSQAARVAFADALIAELEAADTIVIAAPMYNFTVSSTLKAWIDHIARAGRTFRYTASGSEGLLKNKKVYVVVSRGGLYANGGPAASLDFQEPYLRGVLGFLGLDRIEFIHVEGMGLGAEAAEKGLVAAQAKVARLVPQSLAA